MRRSSFLTFFFLGLSALFVIVLAIRIRRDAQQPAPATPAVTVRPPGAPVALAPSATSAATIGVATSAPSTRTAPMVERQQERERSRRNRAADSQPKPSVLSRVLAPLVHAVMPPGKPTQTQKTSPTDASIASRLVRSAAAEQSAQTSTSPKDPNSDTTPPQLLSIAFAPGQIHDGEQSACVINAVDDISGIRGISGTIASPTGTALEGFAAQFDSNSNRWIARVSIPKNAEQGTWKVRFLNLTDNASNSVTLSDAQGTIPSTAVLNVASSQSDSTPPALRNIWVDKPAIQGGDKDTVFVEASDDNSGVALVSLVFQSPSKKARIGAGCQPGDGDVWQCIVQAPTCLDCGDWQLEQVTLQDKANNLATYRQDNPIVQAVRINIEGSSCDNNAPVLQSLTLNANDVAVGPSGATVTVSVAVSGGECGVLGVSGQFSGPSPGSGGVFPMQRSGDGTWVGQIRLDPHAARGTWHVSSIQLNDSGYNLRVYYAGDPLLQGGVFRVH